MRIGVTGHVRLVDGTDRLVFDALTAALRRYAGAGLHGITCLAQGTDQIFARAVLALGGTFEAILPARDYRARMVDPTGFDELLGAAVGVQVLPYARSGRPAYLAASRAMLTRCDLLLAVWDGQPTRGRGDTADVVATARSQGVPVTVLWPAGAARS